MCMQQKHDHTTKVGGLVGVRGGGVDVGACMWVVYCVGTCVIVYLTCMTVNIMVNIMVNGQPNGETQVHG